MRLGPRPNETSPWGARIEEAEFRIQKILDRIAHKSLEIFERSELCFDKSYRRMTLEQKILQFLDRPSEGEFEALALEVYRFQRTHNAIYSKYCDFLGTPLELVSWKDIPGVPQQAFKRSELRSYPTELDSAEFRTSGTTGEGYGRHFFPTLRLYEAAVERTWDHFRLPWNRFLLLMQHPDDASFSSLSGMGGILNGYQREKFFVTQGGELEVDRFRAAVEEER